MIKLNKKLILGASILTIIGSYTVINGFDMDKFDLILEQQSVTQASERDQVLEAFNTSISSFKSLSDDYKSTPNSVGEPYKIYLVFDGYQDKFKSLGNINSILNEEYQWEAPILDAQNNVVTTGIVWNDNGKWSLGKLGSDIPEDMARFISDKSKLTEFIKESGISNPVEVKRVKFMSHRFDAIYILDDQNEEYLVPMAYENISHNSNFENLKLYKASELIDIIN